MSFRCSKQPSSRVLQLHLSLDILVHTAPCCPTVSSLSRRFGLPTDLTPFICHSVLLIVHLLPFIWAQPISISHWLRIGLCLSLWLERTSGFYFFVCLFSFLIRTYSHETEWPRGWPKRPAMSPPSLTVPLGSLLQGGERSEERRMTKMLMTVVIVYLCMYIPGAIIGIANQVCGWYCVLDGGVCHYRKQWWS